MYIKRNMIKKQHNDFFNINTLSTNKDTFKEAWRSPCIHGRVRNVAASLTAWDRSWCVFHAMRQTTNVHPEGTGSRNKLIACAQDFFGDVPVAVCSGHYLAHGLRRAKIAWREQHEYVCCESTSDEPGAKKKDIANPRGTVHSRKMELEGPSLAFFVFWKSPGKCLLNFWRTNPPS